MESMMPVKAKTAVEIVDYLLDNAYQKGECLISHLAPNAKGYIPVQVGGRSGKKWRANRLVCHVINVELTEDDLVRHTCDNRACINPEHLIPGTAQDNTDDMISRGRKVDDPEVGLRRRIATARLIRKYFDAGLSNREISNKLGLSYSTVRTYTFAFSSGHEYPVRN